MMVKVENDKIKDVRVDENNHLDCKNETFDQKDVRSVWEDCTKSLTKTEIENKEKESKELEAIDVSKNHYDKVVPVSVSLDDIKGMHNILFYNSTWAS